MLNGHSEKPRRRAKRRQGGVDMDGLVALFYEAVLAPHLWAESVRLLAQSFGQAATSITCFHEGKGASLTGASDPAFFRQYNEYYGALDPHAARLPRNAPAGTLKLAEELVSPGELERTPYYNEFMKPLGTYFGIGGILRSDENGMEVISLFRAKSQGPFSTGEQQLLGELGSHFRRAREVYYRLQGLTQNAQELKGVLDTLCCALLTCDDRGRVLSANAAAVEDLKRGDILTMAPRGMLALAGGVAQDRLRNAIQQAGAGTPGCLAVRCSWPQSQVIVSLAASPHQGPVKQIVVAWEANRQPDTGKIPPEILRGGLGITKAEFAVAMLIADGCETLTICERLKVQPNTVRTHVKRIFAKTGTVGRADLARLIGRMTASLGVLRSRTR